MTTMTESLMLARGISVLYGGWVCGYAVKHPDGTLFILDYTDDGELRYHQVQPGSVRRFTGLADCNGNEIYEGDTVTNGKYEGRVKWMPGKFCFQIMPGGVFLNKNTQLVKTESTDADR